MTGKPGWDPLEDGRPSPWGPWGREGEDPRWMHRRRRWERHRGRLFLRFAATFGFIVLLVLGGMAALAFLLTRLAGGDGHIAGLVWVGGCGLSLALPILALGLAVRAFRRIATPLAEVMTAADAVANGDLSVRVPVHGPGDFQRLAVSFNRMTEELARSDQQRRNLTADVAHELRNPLHIIQGNLEGLLDGVYQPTTEHLEATLEETRALARLVDDLNTLSLAEAGQLPMNWETLEVPEFLADVCTSFSGPADAAGIVLTAVSTPGLTLTADIGRLDQVLGNLVANALRHTLRGGAITLRAEPANPSGEPDEVRFIISDTGEGIPADDLPYVFDRFWRGDRSRARVGGAGSGLGLAIARQLVHAHGGRIGVESAVGRGTTFTIELPANHGDPNGPPSTPDEPAGRR